MNQKDFALRPWQVSISLHLCVVLAFVIVMLKKPNLVKETYQVSVQIKEPGTSQTLLEVEKKAKIVVKSINQDKASRPLTQAREIFGISRNAYTDETSGGVSVSGKLGNTLTKESDREQLKADDPDSLPVPTEEYLVSQMPALIFEFKPSYPKEAKEKQIEGAVTINILIDEKGSVRQASIIDGPEIFRATALEAIRKFVFSPAKVDGKAVAVKIRYILRFKLEF